MHAAKIAVNMQIFIAESDESELPTDFVANSYVLSDKIR